MVLWQMSDDIGIMMPTLLHRLCPGPSGPCNFGRFNHNSTTLRVIEKLEAEEACYDRYQEPEEDVPQTASFRAALVGILILIMLLISNNRSV